jgi:DNA-binding response OmpR family regulator
MYQTGQKIMKKNKILFVEDEKVLRETLTEALENNNFEVEFSDNGSSALDLLKNNEYDLILLDIILPKKNGFEILEEMKKINKKIPVILLTNLSGTSNIQKALDLGAKNYLVKSEYRLDEIVDRIRELLN